MRCEEDFVWYSPSYSSRSSQYPTSSRMEETDKATDRHVCNQFSSSLVILKPQPPLARILPGSLESKQPKVPVPLPLVTDLDGDGHNEILLLTKGGTSITSISVPYASGETWVRLISYALTRQR